MVEKTMKSKYLTPLILILLILSLGIYLFFFELSPNSQPPSPESSPWLLPDPSLLQKLTLENQSGKIAFQKDETGWWEIVEPFRVSADRDLLQLFIDQIAESKNERIVDESPKDLSLYDLDPPPYKITMELAGQSQPKTFYFGKLNPSLDRIYTKEKGQPEVFLVRRGISMYLGKDLNGFRLKILLLYPYERISEFAIEIVDGNLKEEIPQAINPVLARQITPEGNPAWNILEPLQEQAESHAVKSFLMTLNYQICYEVIDIDNDNYAAFGLDEPRAIIRLTADNGDHIRILFGDNDDEKQYIYAWEQSRAEVLKYPYLVFAQQMDNDFRFHKLIREHIYEDFSRIMVEFPTSPENNYAIMPVRGTKTWKVIGYSDETFPRRFVRWVIKPFQEKEFQRYIYQEPLPLLASRLDPPRAVIKCYQQEKALYQLAVGWSDDLGNTYVLDQLRNQLVLYNEDVIYDLPPDKKQFFSRKETLRRLRDQEEK
jgi:hypothetical protein